MTTKVAIIKAGEWGKLSQAGGDYDHFTRQLQDTLDEAEQKRWTGGKEKAAEVKVVKNVDEARAWLSGKGVAIFLTRGMQYVAEALAKESPKMRVLVFTGLLPEGKVIYISKDWTTSIDRIKEFVLDLHS